MKLLIGELVKVLEDEPFPVDLILLDSELPEGIANRNKNIRWWKIFKKKEAPIETKGKFNEDEEKAKDF